MTYFIEPLNEGQDLNYIETVKCSLKQAKLRAKLMLSQLKSAMPQGTISVKVTDQSHSDELAFFQ
jgi:hypothetical protein